MRRLPRPDFTRQQWAVTITFVVVNFCNAMCVSMQAPFYPLEAEKKGCLPSEYGLVFGAFELTVFLVSPVIGANLNRLGAKMTLNLGIATVGITSIFFGLLDKVENGRLFLGLSFALRIVEACGNSGFLTGSFSMIAEQFPYNVATMFAVLETFFGVGLILGPTVGGALYQVGGFTLPFVTLGGVLVGAALFTSFMLPRSRDDVQNPQEKPSLFRALKVPSIAMASFSVASASSSLGFLQATLEPHLRDFNLSPLQVGSMFVITGACYGGTAPIWGFICDRKPPKVIALLGALLMVVAFTFIGPLPFLGIPKSLPLIAFTLVAHGLGLGAQVVSGFADAHKQALAHGFPNNMDTYGLISGLWTSTFALGAFVGPTLAGILYDIVGFPRATMLIIVSQLIVLVLISSFALHRLRESRRDPAPEQNRLIDEGAMPGTVSGISYGAIQEETEGTSDNQVTTESATRPQRRVRTLSRRTGPESERSSATGSMSLARSLSLAYPHLGVTNSYRHLTPSFSGTSGDLGGDFRQNDQQPQ